MQIIFDFVLKDAVSEIAIGEIVFCMFKRLSLLQHLIIFSTSLKIKQYDFLISKTRTRIKNTLISYFVSSKFKA